MIHSLIEKGLHPTTRPRFLSVPTDNERSYDDKQDNVNVFFIHGVLSINCDIVVCSKKSCKISTNGQSYKNQEKQNDIFITHLNLHSRSKPPPITPMMISGFAVIVETILFTLVVADDNILKLP